MKDDVTATPFVCVCVCGGGSYFFLMGGWGEKQSHYRPEQAQEVKVPRFLDKGTGWW
jgi:hypothetical protein